MDCRMIFSIGIVVFTALFTLNEASSASEDKNTHNFFPGVNSNLETAINKMFWTETNSNIDIFVDYKSNTDCVFNMIIDDIHKIDGITLPSTNGKIFRRKIDITDAIDLHRGMHKLEVNQIKGNAITFNDICISPASILPEAELIDPKSDIKEFGLFDDSCVTSYTPWNIVEENDKIPHYILPAYTGSGLLGISIDGSGMQVLDSPLGRSKRYHQGENFHTDDMYIFGEGFVSDHITSKNLMPLGYFNYSISIDGRSIDSKDKLIKSSSNWRREVDIKKAIITTSFVLDKKVRVKISLFTPIGGNSTNWNISFSSVDGNTHDVKFSPEIVLKTRDNRLGQFANQAIYEYVDIKNNANRYAYLEGRVLKDGKFKPLADYKAAYFITADSNPAYFAYSDRIGFVNQIKVIDTTEINFQAIVIKMESDEIQPDKEGFAARSKAFTTNLNNIDKLTDDADISKSVKNQINNALTNHINDWNSYYSNSGSIKINNAKREMLFNNSLYLLRIAGSHNNGLPICFLLHHPWCWHAATFWDLNFIADSLIHTNNIESVEKIAEWLNQVKQSSGRTFPWMMYYNGESAMQSDWTDSGFHVNPAHAMTAVRLYEATKDKELLNDICYPIIRTVSEYTANERFIKDGDYYIGAGASGDINGPELLNDTFAATWFGVILRKGIEYAEILNTDSDLKSKWQDIVDNMYIENDNNIYHAHKYAGRAGGWMSLLLYPSETKPFIDMKMYNSTRESQSFIDEYNNSGFIQPWVYFWQASSDLRFGSKADIADGLIDQGVRYTYGSGFFAEITPDSVDLVGMPPYQTPHASYLTATTEQLLISSIWDNNIEVFTNLPSVMKQQNISFKNLITSSGAKVSAEYSPDNIKIWLTGSGNYSVIIPKPNTEYSVFINGRQALNSVVEKDGKLNIMIELSSELTTKIEIQKSRGSK